MHLFNVPCFALEAASPNDWRPGAVVVSIAEEWGKQPELDHLKIPMLRVQFSDVEEDIYYDEANTCHPMSPAQANSILDFIDEQRPKCVVVHCAVGSSRSGSVVLALHELYAGKLPKYYWKLSSPKPQMVGLLVREFYRRHNMPDTSNTTVEQLGASVIDRLRADAIEAEAESANPPPR